jgi:serine/threonine protein kinase
MSHASRLSATPKDFSTTLVSEESQPEGADSFVATHDPLAATALAHTLPTTSGAVTPKLGPSSGALAGSGQGSGQSPSSGSAKASVSASLLDCEQPPPAEVEGYEIKEPLGRGAYGTVWLAIQKNTGKSVAIKFYAHAGGLDFHLLRREVESLAFLYTERDIVQLLAVGWDHNPPYYVMEYLGHGSLEERLRSGPLPISEAVNITRVVARALQKAHGRGILHCDLKPANVLFDGNGKPRLCDFGQSRLSTDQKPSLGTFFYMAPEQADLLAVPDARWDVYALGAMLYAMLVGAPPYREGPLTQLLRRATTLPERLRVYREFLLCSRPPDVQHHRRGNGRGGRGGWIDPALHKIVTRCLAADPAQRYPNVQAVLTALELRSARQQRRPLLLLGALGPALLLVVTSLMALKGVRVAVQTSSVAVTQRAREASQFAARFVSETAGREIDRRWNVLEQAALDPQLMALLSASPKGLSAPSPALQRWIAGLSSNNADLTATSWFVTTSTGLQVARVPHSDTIGKNWAFRDYFHGLGHELPHEVTPGSVKPIVRPHRSVVFPSQATGTRLVAFSVPIWSTPGLADSPEDAADAADVVLPGEDKPSAKPHQRRVIGVLGMTVELGRFGELHPSSGNHERQIAVLIDGREDWTGRKGLILQHPQLSALLARRLPLPLYRLDDEHLRTIEALRSGVTSGTQLPFELLFDAHYRDPVSGPYSGQWLMTMRPVLARGRDTGWVVLVQERLTDITEPVAALGHSLLRIGMIGLLLMAAVWLLLWWRVSRSWGRTTEPTRHLPPEPVPPRHT